MASMQPETTVDRQPMEITSVQPGGGLSMRCELWWGGIRKSLLRRFRPGYVQAMLGKRRGECPDCPHDIVDSRDLKYFRNVCGFRFDEQDDAFRWRDRLGLARMGLWDVAVYSVIFLVLGVAVVGMALALHGAIYAALLPIILLWAEIIYFFRDPQREIPTDADALLSPADGTITDVGEVDEPEFPGGRAFRIGIFLSIFNVHVNRIPRNGTVTNLRYYPGQFLDARHPEAGSQNEQLWIDMDDLATGRPMRVKQISGKIARRIICWLKRDETVHAGDRLGMIKFGSRTEIYLPTDLNVDVKVGVGDKVKGGSTVLARMVAQQGL